MEATLDLTPELIRSPRQKPNRLHLFRVRRVDPLEVFEIEAVVVAKDMWADKVAIGIEQSDSLGRGIDMIDVAAVQVVGRNHLDDHAERYMTSSTAPETTASLCLSSFHHISFHWEAR